MSQNFIKRATARLFIFDPDNRLLLIQYVSQRDVDPTKPGVRSFWFTPGGGLEPGETPREAAARELKEETGLTTPVGDEVAFRTQDVTLFRKPVCVVERYFLVRTDTPTLDTSLLAETEGDQVLDVRWWPLDDLAQTSEFIEPFGIVALAQKLARREIPDRPINLGPDE